jgi:hypothetical protein
LAVSDTLHPDTTIGDTTGAIDTVLILEAEKAKLSGPVVASGNPGFTGTGYADYVHDSADYVEFTLNAVRAGTYACGFRYANGGSLSRPLQIQVNGTAVGDTFPFPGTGSWTTWKYVSLNATLHKGINTIRATTKGFNGGNLDHLRISGPAGSSNLPIITRQPQNQTVARGQRASFVVSVSSSTPVSYQWQLNGVNIDSARDSVYTTRAADSTMDSTNYRVIVRNSSGSVTSTSALLRVTKPTTSLPVITRQPQNQTVARGQRATFFVSVSSSTPVTYQWQVNGVNIDSARDSAYTTRAADSTMDSTNYRVVVRNSSGSVTSASAVLRVTKPSLPVITRQPQNQTVARGQRATFTVGVSSPTPVTYQWQLKGVNIDSARDSVYTTRSADSTMDSTAYRVIVRNSAGSVTSTSALLLVIKPSLPIIIRQPQNQTVARGQRASFFVSVSSPTPVSYQWQLNGVNIDSARDSVYTTRPADSTMDSTNYRVVVRNASGSVTSASALLRVTKPSPSLPVITRQPQSQTVARGQRATFTVGISSPTPVTYQWQKNNVNIDSARDSIYTTRAADSTMDSSGYRVIVRNSAGSVTSLTALLRVTKPKSDSVLYEAENGSFKGAIFANNNPGFTGTGFVDFVNASGDSLGWTVHADTARSYSLTIRYANGSAASRPLKITVNGVTVNSSLAFPPTGSWQIWNTVTFTAALKSGSNQVVAVSIGSNGGNLDNLVVK